jgi:hypothetical protein
VADAVSSVGLYAALRAEGYTLPKNCADIELELPVDGAVVVRCRLLLDADDVACLGRALVRLAGGEFADADPLREVRRALALRGTP